MTQPQLPSRTVLTCPVAGHKIRTRQPPGSVLLCAACGHQGNHLSAQDYTYNVESWGLWGAFFLVLPLIVAAIVRAAAAEHQRYRAWKASLTPEQRLAVELAEAAAATATAIALWEHHKAVDARLTSSVMGHTMPDGHTMRPTDRLASYRQRAAVRHPARQPPWDLTGAKLGSDHAIPSRAPIGTHIGHYFRSARSSWASTARVSPSPDCLTSAAQTYGDQPDDIGRIVTTVLPDCRHAPDVLARPVYRRDLEGVP